MSMIDDQLTSTPVAPVESQDAEPEPVVPSAEQPAEEPVVTPEPAPVPEPEPVAQPEPEPIAVEAPAPEPIEEPTVATEDDSRLFEEEFARLGRGEETTQTGRGRLSRGERIEATVIQVDSDRVFVDLGRKVEGEIPLSELAEEGLSTAVGHVQPGDKFEVVVINDRGEGNPIVSKKKADFDLAWLRIVEAFEEHKVFHAQVVDRVKGGLVVDIGVRGFVPATHVGSGKLRNIEKFVGETLSVKIIEIDRERRKVVLSNRQAEEERREEVKKSLFDTVQVGNVLEGTVRRLTDYGAFVDLGGIDGLLHISEMSWVRIDHPREVLKEGDTINVMVLRLDPGGGRISLGLRQVLPDPWNLIKENYKVGQKINVKVTRMVQSGVFVRLPEGAEAFLPVSEISNRRIKRPQEVLEENQEIEPKIIDLKPDERRMVLSLREGPVDPSGYRYSTGEDRRGPGMGGGMRRPGGPGGKGGGRRRDDDMGEPSATVRAPTGGATIGERLGMLKGLIRDDTPATPPAPAPEPTPEPEKPAEGDAS